jgi:hypothetical protein
VATVLGIAVRVYGLTEARRTSHRDVGKILVSGTYIHHLHTSNASASLHKSLGRLVAEMSVAADFTHRHWALCVDKIFNKSLRGREWHTETGPMWFSKVILHSHLTLTHRTKIGVAPLHRSLMKQEGPLAPISRAAARIYYRRDQLVLAN